MRHLWVIGIFLLVFSCSQGGSNKEQPVKDSSESESPVLEEAPSSEGGEVPQLPEDPQRTEWQNPDFVLDLLGNLEGLVVADIGAGSGYFSFKIARRARKVIALDIDPRALDYIKEQIEIVGDWSRNIEPRLTPADVPNLLDEEADVVLIVNTFGFIPNKEEYLPRVLNGLKPGGKLVIVDFKAGNIPVGPSDEFKVETSQVISTLRKAGFRGMKKDEKSLQYQYIVTAKK